jgi:hypothetical protein
MLERDAANGVDVFDHGTPEPAPGPPVQTAPLLPVAIPPPDYRQAADEPLEPEQSLNPAPAKRQKRPKPTPNIDQVRAWRASQ